MKNIIIILLLSAVAWSQNTAVSGQVTDPDGQSWNNGTFSINFIPTPGVPGPFSWNGVINFPQKFTGILDSSGNISITIPDNNFVKPLGSQWRFTLCSNTSASCQDVVTPVSGSSINLGSTFLNNLSSPRFGAGQFSHGYLDLEVTGSLPPGSTYYNVSTGFMRLWNGLVWANLSGGGGGGGNVTGSGTANTIPLWDSASDLTNSQLTNSANLLTFSGNQGFCSTSTCGAQITSRFTKYSGLNAAGEGVPFIAGGQNNTASGNLGSTALGPSLTPLTTTSLQRVICYLVITATTASSSTLPQCSVNWTDKDTSTSETSTFTTTSTGNTVGTFASGSIIIRAAASTTVNVSTTGYVSTGGTMTYSYQFFIELM